MTVDICVLASGSKGNCTYISDGTTRLMIDAGISCRRIEGLLAPLGCHIADIDAVLVTHEHTDHIYGLSTLTRRYAMPVLANSRTASSVDVRLSTNISRFCKDNFDTGFRVGTIGVTPFRTLHDAVCSVGYVLQVGGHKVAYCTDLGTVTPGVRQNLAGCEAVILESNHDLTMLCNGPYPPELQQRIRSNVGHLCNEDSAALQVELARGGTRHIVLAHLSEVNNTPALALAAARAAFAATDVPPPQWLVAMQSSAVCLQL